MRSMKSVYFENTGRIDETGKSGIADNYFLL